MTRDEAIASLQDALNDPAQASRHDEIRAALAKARGPAPPELAARQKAMTHQPGEGAEQYDVRTDPRQLHEGDTSLDTFNAKVKNIGRGMKALGSSAIHPIDTATNPSKRRELERGIDDMVTLGYGQKLADVAGRALGDKPNVQIGATEESDAAAAPGFRSGGNVVGMFSPGATSLIGKNAAGAARELLPVAARTPTTGAAMGMARGALGYEIAAPVIAGAHASSAGRRFEAAKESAQDPFGIIASATFGAAGGAARGNAERIRDPRTKSGRLLQDLNAVAGPGARINKFGEPVSGGIYESPELQNAPIGREGAVSMADRRASNLDAINTARLKAARAQYGDTVDDLIAAHGNNPHPTLNAHSALDAMDAENTVNGVVGDEGTASAINKVRRMLTQQGAQVDEDATLRGLGLKPEQIPPGHRAQIISQLPPELVVAAPAKQISAGDMVKARKIVRSLANNAANPSENRVYQVVLGAMDRDAEAIDPRIREMNAAFAKAMGPIEQSNEIIFGKKSRDPGLTEAQRRTGIENFTRMGEETKAATAREPAFQRFEELGPDYKREADLMRAKVIQEQLRRGEPATSKSLPSEIARGIARRGGGVGVGAVAGNMIGGPVGAAIGAGIGYAGSKYAENPLANRVRLGLPASEALGKVTGRSAVGMDAVARIARNRGKKKRDSEETSP